MTALMLMLSIMAPILIFGVVLLAWTTPGDRIASEKHQREHPEQYPKRNISYYHIPLVSEENKTGMQIFFAVLVGGISLAVILSNW